MPQHAGMAELTLARTLLARNRAAEALALVDKLVARKPAAQGPEDAAAASAAPVERPRLKLAPRTAPLPVIEPASSAPGAAADNAASSSDAGAPDAAPQPKKERVNPFGAAKPREEVLKEKGLAPDPVKEVLKMERGEVIRDETPEEKELRAEVEALRQQVEAFKLAEGPDSDDAVAAGKELDAKELELAKLQVELDDKVRFAKASAARARQDGAASPPGPSANGAASPGADKEGGRQAKAWGAERERGGGERDKGGEHRAHAAPGQAPPRGSERKW